MKKGICIILIVSFISGCITHFDYNFIKSKLWLHGNGYRVEGDILVFRPEFASLHGDTILVYGVPKAIVIALDKDRNEMRVKSLKSDSIGLYDNAEEFEK